MHPFVVVSVGISGLLASTRGSPRQFSRLDSPSLKTINHGKSLAAIDQDNHVVSAAVQCRNVFPKDSRGNFGIEKPLTVLQESLLRELSILTPWCPHDLR